MPGLGNPLAFALGGGPSGQELAYDSLRQAVGDGLRARVGSIVEKWRMAKARGLAAIVQDDRAAMQAFPNLATDFLEVYEEILRIVPPSGTSETDRRDTVVARYTRTVDATHPKLLAQLQALDPLFEILIIEPELTRTTDVGVRAFQDFNPASPLACGPAFDLHVGTSEKNSSVPNFSDDFILYVLLDIGGGTFTPAHRRAILAAQDELNESLPAWVDFRTFTAVGFILDLDLLDVTVFGDGVYP